MIRALFKYLVAVEMAVAFCVMFGNIQSARASSDHIVINEIYPNPATGENEWIEIYNPTLSDIDLSAYTIEDENHSAKKLTGFSVLSHSYFVIEKTAGGFSFGLNNDGDTVVLKLSGLIIDQVIYGDFDNQKGKSFARIPNGQDTGDDEVDFRILAPSKNIENVLPMYSNDIKINEVVPQPASGSADEFIELHNIGSTDVDLSNWQIDDIEGGSSPYTIPSGTMIGARGCIAFYKSVNEISVTGISLNDSGDTARLIDPNGDIKDQISYSNAVRGQSYSRFDSGWFWTLSLTPQLENILLAEVVAEDSDPEILLIDIKTAREAEAGKTVKIKGTVTILPNTLSNQYFYIQDETGGIQIYCYSKDFPALTIGDEIQVEGEISDYYNDKRVKISSASDIIIIKHSNIVATKETTIDEISNNIVGQIVTVEGTVTETSGDTFYIHGSGEIKINIHEETAIDKPKMKQGDKVRVTGVVSRYKDTFQILPFEQSGVTILTSGELPRSGKSRDRPPSNSLLLLITSNVVQTLVCKKRHAEAWATVKRGHAIYYQ